MRRCLATARHGGQCRNMFRVTFAGRVTCGVHSHLQEQLSGGGTQQRLSMDIPLLRWEDCQAAAARWLPQIKNTLTEIKPEHRSE